MIRYALQCDGDHAFEAWFRSSNDYDEQAQAGTIECPVCSSHRVSKAVMAPNIAKSGRAHAAETGVTPEQMAKMMAALRRHVEDNADYVGDKFAEEARRIHYGEADKRDIYGETTLDEARELIGEGVPVTPIPGKIGPDSVN